MVCLTTDDMLNKEFPSLSVQLGSEHTRKMKEEKQRHINT